MDYMNVSSVLVVLRLVLLTGGTARHMYHPYSPLWLNDLLIV